MANSETQTKTGCPNCGSQNIQFKRENQGEIRSKKSKKIIHATIGYCKDCGYTWRPTKKKSKTWLWVLGWICIFPVPLTILMQRNKTLNKKIRYGIIAAGWVFYLLIAFSGDSSKSKNNNEGQLTESTTATTLSVTVTEQITESTTTANIDNSSSNETIYLTAGQKNEYSEEMILNKDTEFEQKRIVFFVPTGKYTVKNGLSKQTQISVYVDEYYVNEDGWQEPVVAYDPILLDGNESTEITIEKDQYIYITEPAVLELTPIN